MKGQRMLSFISISISNSLYTETLQQQITLAKKNINLITIILKTENKLLLIFQGAVFVLVFSSSNDFLTVFYIDTR